MNVLIGLAMISSFITGVVMGVVVTEGLSRRSKEAERRQLLADHIFGLRSLKPEAKRYVDYGALYAITSPEGYQPEGEELDTSNPPQGGSGVPPKPPVVIVTKRVRNGLYLEPRGSHETDPFDRRTSR